MHAFFLLAWLTQKGPPNPDWHECSNNIPQMGTKTQSADWSVDGSSKQAWHGSHGTCWSWRRIVRPLAIDFKTLQGPDTRKTQRNRVKKHMEVCSSIQWEMQKNFRSAHSWATLPSVESPFETEHLFEHETHSKESKYPATCNQKPGLPTRRIFVAISVRSVGQFFRTFRTHSPSPLGP